MSPAKISLHETKMSPDQLNHTDFDYRLEKLMEILKDHKGERTLVLGKCDQTTRRVLMNLHCLTPKTKLQPVGFMKYVLDDNDYGLIKELKGSFENDQRTIGICNEQIFEKVDFGKVDKVILFDFPSRFEELHELLKSSVSKIHVITTPSDPKENIEAVKKVMAKEGGARDAQKIIAKNVYPYPKEDDFWDWNSDEEEEEQFDERDYDYSHFD